VEVAAGCAHTLARASTDGGLLYEAVDSAIKSVRFPLSL
jgi:hypothetical protein